MTGGILQLVATGMEDLIITNNPQITFFKTVFRRHTNFSRDEIDLSFQNSMDFGKTGICTIRKIGDLLHRLFLVIDIPQADIIYRTLTCGEVQTLLAECGVIWDIGDKDPSETFDQEAFDEVEILINEYVDQLQDEIDTIQNDIIDGTLNDEFLPETWITNNPGGTVDEYFEELIDALLEFDPFKLQIRFLQAHFDDVLSNPFNTFDALTMRQLYFEKFVSYATSEEAVPGTRFYDNNLFFLFNVETANYNSFVTETSSVEQVFRNAIDAIYSDVSNYMDYDAYKIFDQCLIEIAGVNPNSTIDIVRATLLEAIRFGLIKNHEKMKKIYDDTDDDVKFIIYKLIPVDGGNYFPSNFNFTHLSQSTVPLDPQLDDNFDGPIPFPIVIPTHETPSGPAPPQVEPANLKHFYCDYDDSIITNMYNNMRNIISRSIFQEYFNQFKNTAQHPFFVQMFDQIDHQVYCSIGVNPDEVANIFHFNNILSIGIRDTSEAVMRILLAIEQLDIINNGSSTITLFKADFQTQIEAIRDTLLADVAAFDCLADDETTLRVLSNSASPIGRTVDGAAGDAIFSMIFRPGIKVPPLITPFPPKIFVDHIYIEYRDFVLNYDDVGNNYSARPGLIASLDLVLTSFNRSDTSLPSFSTYASLNYNMFDNYALEYGAGFGGTAQYNDPLSIDPPVADSLYAIFADFYRDMVLQYSNYFNFLGATAYGNFDPAANDIVLGGGASEARYLLNTISSTYYGELPEDIFYYQDTDYANIPAIKTLLCDEIVDLRDTYFPHYDSNRLLLDMRNITLSPQQDFLYCEYLDLTQAYFDIIENDSDTYYHIDHGGAGDIVVQCKNDLDLLYCNPNKGVLDVIDDVCTVATSFFTSIVNPFNNIDPRETNKFTLYDDSVPEIPDTAELDKFKEDIFGFLYDVGSNAKLELFNLQSIFNSNYGGFTDESQIIQWMRDYAISVSTLDEVFNLKGDTIEDTHAAILAYYENQILIRELNIDKLINPVNGLIVQLQFSLLGGQSANFAWIKRLGHYIIDHVSIRIGGQVMDKHTGEWLELWHSLNRVFNKEEAYKKLIGDVPKLTDFTTDKKLPYRLYIPLQFWFNRHIGAALPMIALHNTKVEIIVKLRDFEDLAYFDRFTEFQRSLRLRTFVLAEYLYVESEERNRIATSKHEYLIDVVQSNNEIIVNQNFIQEDDEETNVVLQKVYFNNPCKELIWIFQRISHFDGTSSTGERKYYNYAFNFDTEDINPASRAKIRFNNRDREPYKDIELYNFIKPHESHISSTGYGVNVYPFALEPEQIQPSGSANLSKIDEVSIVMKLRDDTVTDITNGQIYRWTIYGFTINVLRIMSGQAGLAYFE